MRLLYITCFIIKISGLLNFVFLLQHFIFFKVFHLILCNYIHTYFGAIIKYLVFLFDGFHIFI